MPPVKTFLATSALDITAKAVGSVMSITGTFGDAMINSTAGAPGQGKRATVVPSAAPFVQPPRLEGVLWREETGMALIDGEAYRPGQKIKNTNYRLVEVGTGSVRLRTDQGQELVGHAGDHERAAAQHALIARLGNRLRCHHSAVFHQAGSLHVGAFVELRDRRPRA